MTPRAGGCNRAGTSTRHRCPYRGPNIVLFVTTFLVLLLPSAQVTAQSHLHPSLLAQLLQGRERGRDSGSGLVAVARAKGANTGGAFTSAAIGGGRGIDSSRHQRNGSRCSFDEEGVDGILFVHFHIPKSGGSTASNVMYWQRGNGKSLQNYVI